MRMDDTKTPTAPAPDGAPRPQAEVAARPRAILTLAERMARPEPERTTLLERAVQAGEQFYLRSRSGKEITRRYGGVVIRVGEAARGFSAQHAIHLILYLGDQIEEVEE